MLHGHYNFETRAKIFWKDDGASSYCTQILSITLSVDYNSFTWVMLIPFLVQWMITNSIEHNVSQNLLLVSWLDYFNPVCIGLRVSIFDGKHLMTEYNHNMQIWTIRLGCSLHCLFCKLHSPPIINPMTVRFWMALLSPFLYHPSLHMLTTLLPSILHSIKATQELFHDGYCTCFNTCMCSTFTAMLHFHFVWKWFLSTVTIASNWIILWGK